MNTNEKKEGSLKHKIAIFILEVCFLHGTNILYYSDQAAKTFNLP